MLESGDWEVVEMLADLLKPFQQATTVMGAVRYLTVSTVKPLLYKLLTKTLKITDDVCPTAKAVKQEIKKDLEDKYHKTTVERIINLLLFLILDTRSYHFLISAASKKS